MNLARGLARPLPHPLPDSLTGGDGSSLPSLPEGQAFLVDNNGDYLVDQNGDYLTADNE